MVEFIFVRNDTAPDHCTRHSLGSLSSSDSGSNLITPIPSYRAFVCGLHWPLYHTYGLSGAFPASSMSCFRSEICQPIALPRFLQPIYLLRIFLHALHKFDQVGKEEG